MTLSLLIALGQRPLLADGAMGTQLMLAGLPQGNCGEAWNLTHPERVLGIQRAYAQAGSDCLLTNTFGANRIALARHGHAEEVAAINRAGVDIARQALEGKPGFVLGDIGPFGGMLEPFGDANPEEVFAAFLEQAAALVEANVDAIIVETQTALEELQLALRAVREVGAPCVIASMAFDVSADGRQLRTMMGVTPEVAARAMLEAGVDLLGMNCGAGMNMTAASEVVRRFRAISTLPIMAQPNAGQPEMIDGRLEYHESPASMSGGVAALLAAGASLVGGCCGTTPAHIAAFRASISSAEWHP